MEPKGASLLLKECLSVRYWTLVFSGERLGQWMPPKLSLTELYLCSRKRNLTFYFLIVLFNGSIFWKCAGAFPGLVNVSVFSRARRVYRVFIVHILSLNHPYVWSSLRGFSSHPPLPESDRHYWPWKGVFIYCCEYQTENTSGEPRQELTPLAVPLSWAPPECRVTR